MFIKSLTLKNIRSYTDASITFASGITLLSGDIGCGKTTLLLALEFALFGILRGKTSPAELLRHGERQGSVSLDCEINGHNVSITRVLKRSGANITQSSGTLSVDGCEEELVATELKAKILSLLGYPESLLSKSTNLFRYTVYTPQEQVKLILNESVEERKDIIRKIFNIDKYKVVEQNAGLYSTDLRSRIERLRGQLDDLKTLKEQRVSQEKELENLATLLPVKQSAFDESVKARTLAENSLKALQERAKERDTLQKNIDVSRASLKGVLDMKQSYMSRINELEKELVVPLQEVVFDEVAVKKLEELQQKLREKFAFINKKFGELSARRKVFLDDSVSRLDTCPTCKQEVVSSHKEHIASLNKKGLDEIDKQLAVLKEKEFLFKEKEVLFANKMLVLRKKQQAFTLFTQQKLLRERKEKEVLDLKNLLKVQDEKSSSLQKHIDELLLAFEKFPKVVLDKEQDDLRQKLSLERVAEKELIELKTKQSFAKERLVSLVAEIEKKEKISERVDSLARLRTWITDLFTPLVSTIEKRVLYKVYQEFHSYFANWFSVLVDDDDLVVKLDEEFTPRVFQHGFDTTIENLSGGEKTSVALSYRLALNKVLNDYFGTLHTKGLLILDEPTDGFSSEQVDKLREVLEQLGTKQLLIVSHETRLEALADTVVRVSKLHHLSSLQ